MLKQRIWIWVFLILIVWGSNYLIEIAKTPKVELNIQYDLTENPELSNLRDIKISGTNRNFNVKNTNVILTSTNIEKEGFNKENNFLVSPLILYTGNHAYHENSGFSVFNLNSDGMYRKAEKSLKTILLAMEEGKTWQDIGILDTCLNGKITLTIPDKNSSLFPYVRKLFLVNLEENITEENLEVLLQRVDKLLSKCKMVENVENYLSISYEQDKFVNEMIIGPEYLLETAGSCFSSQTSSNTKQTYFVPIYPTKTVAINYNLLIKNDLSEEIKTKIIEKYSSNKFLKETGIRPVYANTKLEENLSTHARTDVNIVELDTTIEEIVNNTKPIIEKIPEKVEEETKNENPEEKEENSDDFMKWFLIILGIILGAVLIIGLIFYLFANYGY